MDFFTELERRGEDAILRALDTISAHIQWILITGGEAAAGSGKGFLNSLTGSTGVSHTGLRWCGPVVLWFGCRFFLTASFLHLLYV